ncbi:hypothetical protein BGZ58_000295, partial [Dissophora ornata]
TLKQECQEMTDYLSERIWYDSSNDSSPYQTFDSSSSRSQQKTVDEEAQIAAFITCNEQVQASIRRYNELKDFLQAKQMQEDEDAGDRAYMASHAIDNDDDAENNTFGTSRAVSDRIDRSSTYTAAAVALGDVDVEDDFGEDGSGARQSHLRKSEQPLVWKLDPREDFKATQSKMKKVPNVQERRKIDMERHMEKHPRNGVHGMTPDMSVVTPDMLSPDDDFLEKAEGANASLVEPSAPVVEVDEDGLERINNHPEVVEEEEEEDEKVEEKNRNDNDDGGVLSDDEDEAVLSDDSWEEIPAQGIVNLSIEGDEAAQEVDVTSTTSSSTSSFLITPAEAASRVPTPPSAGIREL